jgi:Uma2 family endonuclease
MTEDFLPAGLMGWALPADVFDGSEGVAPMRWTVPMMYAAVKAGIIYEGSRFELLRGQIIQPAQRLSPEYFYIAGVAAEALGAVFGERITRCRGCLIVSEDTYLEPQLLVTRRTYKEYRDAHPPPGDALLIGEIADGPTRTFLLGRKAQVYAESAAPEYWVLLPDENAVLVHRRPTEEGYEDVVPYTWGDCIRPLAAPDAAVSVADLLPARPSSLPAETE